MIARLRVVVLAMLVALGLVACVPGKTPQTPQDVAESSLKVVWAGVKAADEACASFVRAPEVSRETALKAGVVCETGAGLARLAILSGEKAIKSWSAASANQLVCAGAQAVDGLQELARGIEIAGGKVPLEAQKALDTARLLSTLVEGYSCKTNSTPEPSSAPSEAPQSTKI